MIHALRKIFIVVIILAVSCTQQSPDWLAELPQATSPDGNAIVYQSIVSDTAGATISVATWVAKDIGNGGAGIFDIRVDSAYTLAISWTNDSTVNIKYPKSGAIIRQEMHSYFGGRRTRFIYESLD